LVIGVVAIAKESALLALPAESFAEADEVGSKKLPAPADW
jgi:hypothetical protein